MKEARCLDEAPKDKRNNPDAVDPWFPDKGESPNPGKIMCFTCPVKVECKEYRDRTDSRHGMWGGEIKGRNS